MPMRKRTVLLVIAAILPAAGLTQTPICDPCIDGPDRRIPRIEFPDAPAPRPNLPEDSEPLTPREYQRRLEDRLSRESSPEVAAAICPRTDTSRWPTFRFGDSDAGLIGTRAFAVRIRSDVTDEGGPYQVHWYRAGGAPDAPGDFDLTIRRLDAGAATATAFPLADATDDGRWHGLSRIEFPDAGCWEVTGSYQGRRLSFVIGTFRDG
jgi:hypothetical protein